MDGTEEKRSDTGYRTEKKKKNPQRNKNYQKKATDNKRREQSTNLWVVVTPTTILNWKCHFLQGENIRLVLKFFSVIFSVKRRTNLP